MIQNDKKEKRALTKVEFLEALLPLAHASQATPTMTKSEVAALSAYAVLAMQEADEADNAFALRWLGGSGAVACCCSFLFVVLHGMNGAAMAGFEAMEVLMFL
jgi:hypothetical protein